MVSLGNFFSKVGEVKFEKMADLKLFEFVIEVTAVNEDDASLLLHALSIAQKILQTACALAGGISFLMLPRLCNFVKLLFPKLFSLRKVWEKS